MMKRILTYLLSLILLTGIAVAADDAPPDDNHGITVREAQLYISPDTNSAKLAEVSRGREVIVLEESRNWIHVLAGVGPQKDINGWMLHKGVVHPNTPDGDKILFGEAAASELVASQRGGRKGAADDARRMYYRTYEYFPKSPLAGEGLYRAADILWQVGNSDISSLRSYRERDPNMRPENDPTYMKLVMKKFPGTKWADLAAFHLIENKLCGDWEGSSKCPEKESEMYEKYAAERPSSPKAAEALYNAAWRQASLIEIYKTENKAKQVDEARAKAKSIAAQIASKYPDNDWAFRARALAYQVEQQIPVYGNAIE